MKNEKLRNEKKKEKVFDEKSFEGEIWSIRKLDDKKSLMNHLWEILKKIQLVFSVWWNLTSCDDLMFWMGKVFPPFVINYSFLFLVYFRVLRKFFFSIRLEFIFGKKKVKKSFHLLFCWILENVKEFSLLNYWNQCCFIKNKKKIQV